MPIDMSLATPPPARGGKRTVTPAPSKRLTPAEKRKQALDGLGQVASFGLIAAKQYADAATIGAHFGDVADEVVKLADSNEKVAKAIDYLTEVGPYAGLITAALPMVMQLLCNHKLLDHEKIPGASDPQLLEMEMQTQMRKQALEQMREARQARADAEMQIQEWNRFVEEQDQMQWTPDGSESESDGQRAHP